MAIRISMKSWKVKAKQSEPSEKEEVAINTDTVLSSCPECKKSFKSERGLKLHTAKAH